MEKISWTDRVKNEDVLHTEKEYSKCNKKKEGQLDCSYLTW